MAKVSLRIYNREIESLVDQGNTQEAIAHCHHILKTFPKHLETYRLLGKAHLEAKRYTEAVDIFSRVLMAVPEDFVAHVGMSIMSDEQNKFDDAIWHMERAFESQPSNAAIQSELQRLYGRRDGMEPPKIRMTRGALAHMYVQGELYPQAVAEVRAVLAGDPNRGDMQILLARAYFRSGQKSDASDMCGQLLKQYPYCLDANRIMVELIPSTAGAAENTQVYRARVIDLDPYASFTKGSIFQSNEVADAAVNLEHLEYTGNEVPIGQDWGSSLGIELAASNSSSDEQPDWLKSGGVSDGTNQFQLTPASVSGPEDEIPDFLRSAGWAESNTPEQPTSMFDQESASGSGLVSADLPDWLKSQAPITEPLQSAQIQSLDTPDWLNELGSEPTTDAVPAQPNEVSDWLTSLDGAQNDQALPATVQAGDTPDWLAGLGDEKTINPVSDEPDQVSAWLSGLDEEKTTPETQSSDLPDWLGGLGGVQASESGSAQPGEIPDWLRDLGDSKSTEPLAAQPNAVPEWLNGLDDSSISAKPNEAPAWLNQPAKTPPSVEEIAADPIAQSETPPEWIPQAQGINSQTYEKPSTENLGATAQEQDDAVAWLESLAAKHGAKPEEMVSDPNKRSDTPPEWVQQAQAIGETESISKAQIEEAARSNQQEAQPAKGDNALNIGEQYFVDFENTSAGLPASDATGMWLRDLNEKEKQNDFITPPISDSKETPEWIRTGQSLPEEREEQNLQHADIPDWIKGSQPGSSAEPIKFAEELPAAQNSDLPNWLSGIEEESATKHTVDDQGLSNQDLSSWLNGLDDEPGLPFESMPTPNSILSNAIPRPITPDRPLEQESVAAKSADLPDWLSDVDAKQEEDLEEDLWKKSIEQELDTVAPLSTEEPAPVSEAVDLPDWLIGTQQESVQVAEVEMEDDDTPPWMHREKFETEETLSPPVRTTPSDWHPVDVKESAPALINKVPPSAEFIKPAVAVAPIPTKKKPNPSARQPQAEAQNTSNILIQAKGELDRGDIPTALNHYGKLIKKGKHLEDAIRDLNESIYRYPVEVGIWQTLGDAYMRANRLKEALEAYNKAEELIR
jgi:tetratricopeptide (TPR) repeat protein